MSLKKVHSTVSVSTKEAIAELFQKLDDCDLDPITELALLAKDPNVPLDERIGILKSLMSYTTPKRKAVDFIKGEDDEGITIKITQYSKTPEQPRQMIDESKVERSDLTSLVDLRPRLAQNE